MITSIVITNPKDWADESILLPHELIRNAILRMETVLSLENFGENLNWKMEYFHKWYNYIIITKLKKKYIFPF